MSEVGWGEGGVGVPVTLINSRMRGNSERYDGLIDGHGNGFRNGKSQVAGFVLVIFGFINFKAISSSLIGLLF